MQKDGRRRIEVSTKTSCGPRTTWGCCSCSGCVRPSVFSIAPAPPRLILLLIFKILLRGLQVDGTHWFKRWVLKLPQHALATCLQSRGSGMLTLEIPRSSDTKLFPDVPDVFSFHFELVLQIVPICLHNIVLYLKRKGHFIICAVMETWQISAFLQLATFSYYLHHWNM